MTDTSKEAVMRINAQLSQRLTDQGIAHEPVLEASAAHDLHVQQMVNYESLLKQHLNTSSVNEQPSSPEATSEITIAVNMKELKEAIRQIQDLTTQSEGVITEMKKISLAEITEKDVAIDKLQQKLASVSASEQDKSRELQKSKKQYEELQKKLPAAGKSVHQGWKWGCVATLVVLFLVVVVWIIVSLRDSSQSPVLDRPTSAQPSAWDELPAIPPVR